MKVQDMVVGQLFCNGYGDLFNKISDDTLVCLGYTFTGISARHSKGYTFPVKSNMLAEYTKCSIKDGMIVKEYTFSELKVGQLFSYDGCEYEKIAILSLNSGDKYNAVEICGDLVVWIEDSEEVEVLK